MHRVWGTAEPTVDIHCQGCWIAVQPSAQTTLQLLGEALSRTQTAPLSLARSLANRVLLTQMKEQFEEQV